MINLRNVLVRSALQINNWILRRDLRIAMLKSRYFDRHTPFDEPGADIEQFRALEYEVAQELGLGPERKPTDRQKALLKFDVTPQDFNKFGSSELDLPLEADLVLSEWIKEHTSELKALHWEAFHEEDETQISISTTVINGRPVQSHIGFIASYAKSIHYILMFRYKSHNTDEWMWHATVRGPSASKLSTEFQQRHDAFLIARLRGKALNNARTFIELKRYRREDLVYPHELGQRIDELLAAFHRWAEPSSRVRRWGSLLIGRPGTGKTTIGGLIGAARPDGCTFLYFPAADVNHPAQITNAFTLAKKLEPCVLQIDDVDLIARDRRENNGGAYTSALMEALDGLEESAKIFVIMSSNDVSKMEPAIVDRAGRISSKLIFTGFQEVCDDMIAMHAQAFGLTLAREDINAVVLAMKEKLNDFTPDEAKNICQRLYLLYGEAPITAEQLKSAIAEAAQTFHSETANQSFLPVQKPNGKGRLQHVDPQLDYD